VRDSRLEGQRFYREVPVDDGKLAFRRFFATNFGLRCPACGRCRVTKGLAGVRERCANCGSRYQRLQGNELISISLSFFLASVITFLVALPLIRAYGFFPGVTWALVAVGVASVVLLQRPTKVLALWLLWMIGFVYPDGVVKGATTARPATADNGGPAEPDGGSSAPTPTPPRAGSSRSERDEGSSAG
jgi:uncharacterized protein (DUF983 family)